MMEFSPQEYHKAYFIWIKLSLLLLRKWFNC